MKIQSPIGESYGRTCQIQLPRTPCLFANCLQALRLRRAKPLDPCPASHRVMAAQILDVQYLKARPFGGADHICQGGKWPVLKDSACDEKPFSATSDRRWHRNPVIEEEAFGRHQLEYLSEVLLQ